MRALLLGLAAFGLMSAAEAATPPDFQLRFTAECQANDKPYVLIGANEEYCLDKVAVLDSAAVVKVERYPVVPKAVMEITKDASEQLYTAMEGKDGQRLGFVFNGRLIYAPLVGDPVKITELVITLKNDPDDIDALVAAFPGPKEK